MKSLQIVVILLVAQCAWAQPGSWDELLGRSADYLDRIQTRLQTNNGVAEADRWDLYRPVEKLVVSLKGELSVTANFQFVGNVYEPYQHMVVE